MLHAHLDSCRSVFLRGLLLFPLAAYAQAQTDRASVTRILTDASAAVISVVNIADSLDTQLC